MKKDVRLVVCIVVILLLVLLCLYKCTAEQEDENDLNSTPPVVSEIPTRMVTISQDSENNQPQINLVSIVYYTIIGAGGIRIDTAETFVEEHVIITPDLIVDYCLDSFMDEDVELTVLHTSVENGMCTIDFNDSILKVAEESKVSEICVLDALAMSLLDNCEDVTSVSFTINSKEYVTDNITLELGSSYLSR